MEDKKADVMPRRMVDALRKGNVIAAQQIAVVVRYFEEENYCSEGDAWEAAVEALSALASALNEATT